MFNAIWSFILHMVYKTKHTNGLHDLPKLMEVIMSCDQPAHCDTARRYIQLYSLKHLSVKDGYTRTAEKVMRQFMLFLDDTEEHAIHGSHTPEHNGNEPITTFPNMNNYVGKVLAVKFKPMWTRGVTSIVGPK